MFELSSLSKRLSLLSAITIVLSIPIMGMIITSRFTPNPWALTPVGILVLVSFLLCAISSLAKYFRSRLKGVDTSRIVLAMFLLTNPTTPNSLITELSWQNTLDNFTWAWRASFEINVNHGWTGIAPLFHKPIVPNQPLTLVTIHNPVTGMADPYSIFNGYQQFPLSYAPAILHTLPEQALPINDIVFLTNARPDVAVLNELLISSLQASCLLCQGQISVDIHPLYVTSLVIDRATMHVGSLGEHADDIFNYAKTAFDPYLDSPWNLKLHTVSTGVTFMAGSEFTWFVDEVSIYSGSILGGDFAIATSNTSHLAQVYGQTSEGFLITNDLLRDLESGHEIYDPVSDWQSPHAPTWTDLPNYVPEVQYPIIPDRILIPDSRQFEPITPVPLQQIDPFPQNQFLLDSIPDTSFPTWP